MFVDDLKKEKNKKNRWRHEEKKKIEIINQFF
jgi:hypothetical protein